MLQCPPPSLPTPALAPHIPERWKLHDAVCFVEASRLRLRVLSAVATVAMDCYTSVAGPFKYHAENILEPFVGASHSQYYVACGIGQVLSRRGWGCTQPAFNWLPNPPNAYTSRTDPQFFDIKHNVLKIIDFLYLLAANQSEVLTHFQSVSNQSCGSAPNRELSRTPWIWPPVEAIH